MMSFTYKNCNRSRREKHIFFVFAICAQSFGNFRDTNCRFSLVQLKGFLNLMKEVPPPERDLSHSSSSDPFLTHRYVPFILSPSTKGEAYIFVILKQTKQDPKI